MVERLRYWRENPPRWETAVIVGCGGNYWYSKSLLQTLLHRDSVDAHLVDPDTLTEMNHERQWTGHPLLAKAMLARDDWCPNGISEAYVMKVSEFDLSNWFPLNPEDPCGVIVVGLPDNHKARIDCCRLAEQLIRHEEVSLVSVLVAGTAVMPDGEEGGEAFYGLIEKGEEGTPQWIHDWRYVHPDVTDADGDSRSAGCGQNPIANYMTGACVGLALQEIMGQKPTISEWAFMGEDGRYQIRKRVVMAIPAEGGA